MRNFVGILDALTGLILTQNENPFLVKCRRRLCCPETKHQNISARSASLLVFVFVLTTYSVHVRAEAPMMMPQIDYPATKPVEMVEDHFGQKVEDSFRWLENDVRSDRSVANWVDAQNKITDAYLEALPGREIFKARLKQLSTYERFSIPLKKGSRYFYNRTTGEENQRILYVRDIVDGAERVLIDPNVWAKDGATALAEWAASDDGTRLAYAVQDGGTDWRTIRVLDVNTGKVLSDEVKWARFTTIAWAKDGSGFFYNRFPEPKPGVASQARVENHATYFHSLGTPQAQDRLVYATPDEPIMLHSFTVTSDGRYLAIISSPGSLTNTLIVVDLASADWKPRKLVDDFDAQWNVIDTVGTKFFLLTTKDAPRLKVVTMDLANGEPDTVDLVPEQDAVLSGGFLVGGRLLLSYQVDAAIQIRRHTLDGTADGLVKLPGIGTAVGFGGGPSDKETFFGFTSYNVPGTIYRYDVAGNTMRVWSEAKVASDLEQIVVEQRFFTSKDGTRIPMFVVRRKDVTGPAPTLLYAYGGWAISEPPQFSSERLAWVEQGGVFAAAHIRGGGEYGKPWHDAGRRQNKQNTFDDFIAAGEYLKAQSITSPDGLAI